MLDMATVNCDDGFVNLEDYELDSDMNSQREHDDIRSETTISSVQKLFGQRQDILFNSIYEALKTKMCMAFQTDSIQRFPKEMIEKPYLRDMKDHLGRWRTFLHIDVEELNVKIVQCLLRVGFNPNAKEKCGITPIIISVIRKSQEMCQLMVDSRASVRAPLFTSVPSPVAMAKKMELVEILEILNSASSDDEDDQISFYDPVFQSSHSEVREYYCRDQSKLHEIITWFYYRCCW